MIAKCPCEHCGVNIEFATEEFLSGSSVPCPTCGKETLLSVSHQAKPAPKPAAPVVAPPKNFIPDKKPVAPVSERVSTTALTALLFLNLAATIAAGVIIFLIWQRQSAAPLKARYDVKEFTYTSYTHKSEYSDKRYKTVLVQTRYNHDLNNWKGTDSEPEDAFDAVGVLDRLGGDGWQLVWSDGTRYIVQRPQGDWYHDSFRVEQMEETNRASAQ